MQKTLTEILNHHDFCNVSDKSLVDVTKIVKDKMSEFNAMNWQHFVATPVDKDKLTENPINDIDGMEIGERKK